QARGAPDHGKHDHLDARSNGAMSHALAADRAASLADRRLGDGWPVRSPLFRPNGGGGGRSRPRALLASSGTDMSGFVVRAGASRAAAVVRFEVRLDVRPLAVRAECAEQASEDTRS